MQIKRKSQRRQAKRSTRLLVIENEKNKKKNRTICRNIKKHTAEQKKKLDVQRIKTDEIRNRKIQIELNNRPDIIKARQTSGKTLQQRTDNNHFYIFNKTFEKYLKIQPVFC